MVACSRLVFAMSRDGRFPAHRLMRRVSPRTRTPIPATVLVFALGVVLMVAVPGAALLEPVTASTILPAVTYGSTIVLYLTVRSRLSRKRGAFDLGRFELPVAVCALVWTLIALFVLVTPKEALVSVVIVVGLLLLGGLFRRTSPHKSPCTPSPPIRSTTPGLVGVPPPRARPDRAATVSAADMHDERADPGRAHLGKVRTFEPKEPAPDIGAGRRGRAPWLFTPDSRSGSIRTCWSCRTRGRPGCVRRRRRRSRASPDSPAGRRRFPRPGRRPRTPCRAP